MGSALGSVFRCSQRLAAVQGRSGQSEPQIFTTRASSAASGAADGPGLCTVAWRLDFGECLSTLGRLEENVGRAKDCRFERRFRFCISAGSSCFGLLQVLSVVALASAVLVLPNINEFTSARRLPGTFLAVLVLRLRTIQVEECFAHFWVFGEGFTPVWRDVYCLDVFQPRQSLRATAAGASSAGPVPSRWLGWFPAAHHTSR